MTYLDAVNKVLVRLREQKVTTVQENAYSSLIGEYINDAFRLAEDAWDWSALRETLTLNTVASTFSYSLTGSGNRAEILDVVNDDDNFFMHYKPAHWFNNMFLNQEPPEASPQYYSFNGVDSNGDTLVDLYPVPDAVYTLRFNVILRSDSLSNDTDEIDIPHLPVIHMAVAMAAGERGENGGRRVQELMHYADRSLADAIALDAHKHPEELVYRVV